MKYVVGEAFLNIRHGGIVSLLAIFIVALTTVLFSALSVLGNAVRGEVRRFEESPAAVAFIQDAVSDEVFISLDREIRRLPGVGRTVLVSKEEALGRARRIFGDQSSLLLEGFEATNPLPRSIEIYTAEGYHDPASVKKIVEAVRKMEGIENVVFESESLEMLTRVRKAVYLLGGLIGLISVVVVSFSIMLTIYARREELAILQLVGATYGFIRVPLLLQGCLEGFLGSELGLFVFYLLFRYLGPTIGLADFLTARQIALIVGGATAVGMIGGMIPLRRRLRLVRQ